MKTARFKDLVAQGGPPSVHLSWTPPGKDSVLKKALQDSRVLTIHQRTRGAKKDYGVVGLEIGPDAQYLIFPKSLGSYSGMHVVGIQYDLLEGGLSVGPTPAGRKKTPPPNPKGKGGSLLEFPTPLKPVEVVAVAPKPSELPNVKPPFEYADLDPKARKVIRQAIADLEAGLSSTAERRLKTLLPP